MAHVYTGGEASPEPPVDEPTHADPLRKYHFEDPAYPRLLFGRLQRMRIAEEYTDVTLKAGDVTLSCHKVALSAASEYFHAMFSSGLEEATSGVVEIHETHGDTLKLIVDYIYSGEIDITVENVQNLIQACDHYQFEGLKQACEGFLLQEVEASNCIGFYRFSKLYSLNLLTKGAMDVKLTHFKEVVNGPEFNELDQNEVIEYLKQNDLEVPMEDIVFEAVIKWIQHLPEVRRQHFPAILRHIRLPFCSCAYLCHVVRSEPMMVLPECVPLLDEARLYHLIPEKKHELSSPRMVPRHSFPLRRRLVIVGGLTREDKENRYCWFLKDEDNTWELLAQLPRPNWKFYSVCVITNGILLTGGYHSNVKKDCWLFDIAEKKWKSMPAMLDARCKHRAVVHGENVYVLGGEDDVDRPLSTVERLDCRSRQWFPVPPMPRAVSDPLVVSHGRYVYVFGGIEDGDTTATYTQVYDTVWEQWAKRAQMPVACRLGSAIVVNDRIFVVGGYTRTCMAYDPNLDQWAVLPGPREKHGNAPAVLWRGRILVAGGDVDTNETSSVVEEYDRENHTWTYWKLALKEELSCHYLLNVDLGGL